MRLFIRSVRSNVGFVSSNLASKTFHNYGSQMTEYFLHDCNLKWLYIIAVSWNSGSYSKLNIPKFRPIWIFGQLFPRIIWICMAFLMPKTYWLPHIYLARKKSPKNWQELFKWNVANQFLSSGVQITCVLTNESDCRCQQTSVN